MSRFWKLKLYLLGWSLIVPPVAVLSGLIAAVETLLSFLFSSEEAMEKLHQEMVSELNA